MTAATVLLEGLGFGEGPRWHDGKLWFSDCYRRAVYTVDLDGTETKIVDVPQQPSGLGWLADGLRRCGRREPEQPPSLGVDGPADGCPRRHRGGPRGWDLGGGGVGCCLRAPRPTAIRVQAPAGARLAAVRPGGG